MPADPMTSSSDGVVVWWLVYLAATVALTLPFWRRQRISAGAGATLILLGLALPGPALLRGQILGPVDRIFDVGPWNAASAELGVAPVSPRIFSDVWTEMIPWQRVVREAWLGGEWPLWNPYVLAGSPLASSFSSAPYWPPSLLALLAPALETHTLLAALKTFLAAFTAFLLLRDRGLSEGASLVGAAAWAYATFQLFWLGWPQTSVTCLLPLVLMGSGRLARAPSAPNLALLSAALALAALAGHAETLAHLTLLAVADFAWSWWRAPDRARWRARLATGLAAGALAFALAALFVVPFLADLGQTHELAVRRKQAVVPRPGIPTSLSAPAVVAQFVPFLFGVEGRALAEVKKPHESFSTAYLGSVALTLAAIGAVGAVASRRRDRWLLLAAAAGGIGAGVSFWPVIRALHEIPILNLAVHQRLVFVGAWALAVLAAFGWERLEEPGTAGLARRPWLVAVVAALAAGAISTLLWSPLRAAGLPAAMLGREIAWYVAPLGLLALLLALGARRTGTAFAVVALVVVQRLGECGHYHPAVPRAADYPVVRPFGRLLGAESDGRFVGVGAVFLPNTASAFRLEDVRGYDPMTMRRYQETFPLWTGKGWFTIHPVEDLDRPFLDFLGVRHAVVRREYAVPAGWRRVGASPLFALLRNDDALPLAFVPARLRAVTAPERTVAEMAAATSFADEAWLETAPGTPMAPAVPPPPTDNASGRVEAVNRVGLGRYELRTRFEQPGWVVTSIPAWRGWRASADGRPLATAVANHAFVAFLAPPGLAEPKLVYRPRAFDLGLVLSGVGLVAWIALVVVARRRQPSPINAG